MCKSQNKEFGMYYNQKNTCVKVEKTEFSMYSGSKKTGLWHFHHRDLF